MDNNNKQNQNSNWQTITMLVIAALLTILIVGWMNSTVNARQRQELSYNEFVNMVENGKVESISVGATLLESFMPETSDKVLAQLGAQKRKLSQMDTFGLYPSGNKVTEKPEILFARMDINEVMAKVAELHPAKEEVKEEEKGIDIEPKEEITFEEFGKMQFQVGEIISCEAVKKSKKLLCSQVKIGSQVKQIVSGIKAHYTPEEMVGKKVMVLVNLKPAKLAGVLSEGMLLCAEDENGELSLMVPEKKMPSGAEIC